MRRRWPRWRNDGWTCAMHEFAVRTPLGAIAGLRNGREGAPRVLALHGWLDNAASFVPLAPYLDDVDLVAIDLPGHGRSAHLPPGADYSFAGALNTVLDAADALGWDRFALLGHSMGAGIASLIAAACPQRIERGVFIEALGALAEDVDRTVSRMREAVAATRALPGKRLRVFPTLEPAIRARMQANQLSEPVARLLVERGVDAVEGGYVWSSDPRLTLPTMTRMTEAQIADLVRGIECPARVIFADPAQTYLPDPLRRARAALLPQGELIVLAGGHHLHMEQPRQVAAAITGFFHA
ncbi:pimeloyl-ACP methyl ester carboxylesterase [Luteimonas cucumeris]|uniref:Pimeloyl-ACP methyl ester carboxylesterase n=2 Tax=Luteimonas cucumeris TaxID=985012 RepID=A0A562KVJ7_9GAMM|nr:pimeloyl-ACP methyl ester carboxylesterase [Luteimonas cucumeris]